MTESNDNLQRALESVAPRRRALIGRIARQLVPSDNPRVLYHYTSPGALLQIAHGNVLRATHIRFLNDKLEFAFAMERMTQRLHLRVKTADAPTTTRLERLIQVVGEARLTDAYVASFSQHGDTLSQWRAYCPAEGGYAIGFETARLMRSAILGRFLVLKCEYEESKQDAILDDLITAVLEFMEEATSRRAYPAGVLDEVEQGMSGLLLLVAARAMKHASFSEEGEWRLVWLPPMDPSGSIQFRPGKFTLIPFRELLVANIN